MLLTRHYDQRPFDETVCDAIIANGGVKNCQKRCKSFAMADTLNTVQILVACAMKGIRFSSMNCLRWGGTKETGSQMEACAIHSIRFTRMNCLRWDMRTETVQLNKMCVIHGKHVCNPKCVWRPIRTHTVAANKTCVLCDGIAYRTTTYILKNTALQNQIKHTITQVTTHITFPHTKVRNYMHTKLGEMRI